MPNNSPISTDWMPLADRILERLYSSQPNVFYGTLDMAKVLDVTETEVIIACEGILSERPGFISEKKLTAGYGDNLGSIYQMNGIKGRVEAFLAAGGFTAIQKTIQEQLQETQQQKSREALLSQLQISELLRLPEEAIRTRRLARAAIIVAIATLLFEIGKHFLT